MFRSIFTGVILILLGSMPVFKETNHLLEKMLPAGPYYLPAMFIVGMNDYRLAESTLAMRSKSPPKGRKQ